MTGLTADFASDTSLTGRVVLVTGASRGIGRAAALALAKAGAHVVALARTVGALEELDDAIKAEGGSATLVPADIKDFDALDRLGAGIFERWGKLDGVLANAGILGTMTPLAHHEPKRWDEVMAVVKRAVDAVAAVSPRVSLVLKADIRPGYTGQLTAKVQRIEDELGT